MKEPRLALVTWIDATGDDTDDVNAAGPIGATRESAGWLIRNDDWGIVLAFSRDSTAPALPVSFAREFRIPALYIKKVRYL